MEDLLFETVECSWNRIMVICYNKEFFFLLPKETLEIPRFVKTYTLEIKLVRDEKKDKEELKKILHAIRVSKEREGSDELEDSLKKHKISFRDFFKRFFNIEYYVASKLEFLQSINELFPERFLTETKLAFDVIDKARMVKDAFKLKQPPFDKL